jgi:ABC-type multidrug transport system ATPase subunit
MKRRVGIAQALLGEPKLLIVDEPTAGLDPEERVRFRNLLAELARSRVVVLSTHIVEDIGQSCRRMAVLWQGMALFRGAPGELVARARGKVWTILSGDGERPDDDLVVVSTRQLQDGIHQYRVLGEPARLTRGGSVRQVLGRSRLGHEVTCVEPTLEDGYIWLMHKARAADR